MIVSEVLIQSLSNYHPSSSHSPDKYELSSEVFINLLPPPPPILQMNMYYILQRFLFRAYQLTTLLLPFCRWLCTIVFRHFFFRIYQLSAPILLPFSGWICTKVFRGFFNLCSPTPTLPHSPPILSMNMYYSLRGFFFRAYQLILTQPHPFSRWVCTIVCRGFFFRVYQLTAPSSFYSYL